MMQMIEKELPERKKIDQAKEAVVSWGVKK